MKFERMNLLRSYPFSRSKILPTSSVFNLPTQRMATAMAILIGGEVPISNLILHLLFTCILWFLKFQ